MNFEEYIEDLCKRHPWIKHSEDECHYSCLADDSQTKLARNMQYPAVVLDTGDFSFTGQVGNELMNTEYSIMFLDHVRDTGHATEVLRTFRRMKSIALSFIRKISRDKKKSESRRLLARFSVLGSEGRRIYLKDSGLYGYILFLNIDESFSYLDCEHVFED